ncbi:rhomboid family intramembrane serine protease [Oscillatoria sp. FACHB-1406]|uniref:rhomboid family intramembrane serine protease n=1 Tax=Oscillatoria sp. FACHB-1406 TaxID=2692846 RepID=UPI001685A10F|nr:rhomboid family intramembrane serine protease [Oscillatoria sp. FACHB-1406]MBD2578027.1 rhomboid family intramembrane serine protease [Oscillatoria sp. FACHB-1406]
MSLDILLLWTVCLSCFSILIRAIRSPYYRGWSVVSSCILALTIALAFLAPKVAIAIGGSLWGMLILLPLLGSARVNKLVFQQRYRTARRLAMQLRWLHPADGWLEHPQLLLALEMGQQGAMNDAIAILDKYRSEQTPFGRQATTLLYSIGAYWEELRTWVECHIPDSLLRQETHLLPHYLRALGEVGELDVLAVQAERYLPLLEQNRNAIAANWVRMLTLAFCGYPQQVAQLFDSSLKSYSPKIKEFWLLTAHIAAQPQELSYREKLAALSTSEDALLSNSIAWRLAQENRLNSLPLADRSRAIVSNFCREVKEPISYARALTFIPKAAYATYTLIAINCVFFLLEIKLGGSENEEVLYQLGAVVPTEIQSGQWWRLVNANFLHFGAAHLITNMIGLYLLGPFVELRLQFFRYLLIYFLSGIGSMYAFAQIALRVNSPEQLLLVGASASIMGLIGSTTAILLKGWLFEKSRIAAQRLRLVALIIIVQIIFDYAMPQVSFLAHALGYTIGFIAGVLLIIK